MRNYRFNVGLFVAVAVGLTSCTTIPPKEVHTGAGILRSTVLDPTPHDQVPRKFSIGGSISRGAGNRDVGKQVDSTNLAADLELRIIDRVAIGLQPYFSVVDGKFDSRSHLGAVLYSRLKVWDVGRWAVSLYPGLGYGDNSAEAEGTTCGIFGCIGNNERSQSRVEIVDPKLGLIASYYLNDRNVFSLIPTLYYTHKSGSYSVSNIEKFSGSENSLEYSTMLAYGYLFEAGEGNAMIQFSAGAATHRGFGAYASTQHIVPLLQLGLQFALGSDVNESVRRDGKSQSVAVGAGHH